MEEDFILIYSFVLLVVGGMIGHFVTVHDFSCDISKLDDAKHAAEVCVEAGLESERSCSAKALYKFCKEEK